MSHFIEEQFKAFTDPHGLSEDCYPDGTPMTNAEKWIRMNDRSRDYH